MAVFRGAEKVAMPPSLPPRDRCQGGREREREKERERERERKRERERERERAIEARCI